MKQGLSLMDLAVELDRQQASKHDYLASTAMISMVNGKDLQVNSTGTFAVSDLAHNQIGERLGIPAKYYRKMQEELPHLLDYNVNSWFHNEPEKRLVRTLDGKVRAFLSDRYRCIDNYQVMAHIIPLLDKSKEHFEVQSCAVTERRLYVKVSTPKLVQEVRKGDPVCAGFIISNSEVGAGSLSVFPHLTRLACLNGATYEELGKRKYHIGRVREEEEDVAEVFQDDTLAAEDQALMLKLRDVVHACIDEAKFGILIGRLREADGIKLADPEEAVKEVTKRYGFSEGERKGMLKHLVEDMVGMSIYGLHNSITSYAQEIEDYDRAAELQAIGGDLVSLPERELKAIAG